MKIRKLGTLGSKKFGPKIILLIFLLNWTILRFFQPCHPDQYNATVNVRTDHGGFIVNHGGYIVDHNDYIADHGDYMHSVAYAVGSKDAYASEKSSLGPLF